MTDRAHRQVEQRAERVGGLLERLAGLLQDLSEQPDLAARADEVLAVSQRLRVTLGSARQGPCRVACVGRTKVGKSTLRFVLTGDAEEGIGRGGQRTTTSNIDYVWRDVLLVDTPGVGAVEGRNDARVASTAASAADIVLWVVGSDGLQLATIAPVQQMLRRGVPLLVLINHKEVIELDDLPRWSDDELFEESNAHDNRVRQVLSSFGRSDVVVVNAHLDVARSARKGQDEEAWRRSRLPQFEEALADAAAHALAGRPRTRMAALLSDLRDSEALARLVERSASVVREDANEKVVELELLIAATHERFDAECGHGYEIADRSARGSLSSAAQQANAEEHRGKAQAQLATNMTTLLTTYRQAVTDAASAALAQAATFLGNAAFTAPAAAISFALPQISTELKGNPQNARAARTVTRGVQVVSTALIFTPVGWVARLAMLAVPAAIEGLGGSLGPSLEEEQKLRNKSVDEVRQQVIHGLTELRDQAQTHWCQQYAQLIEVPAQAEAAASRTSLRALHDLLLTAKEIGHNNDER